MPTPSFIQNYTQVVAGIRLCVEKRLFSPALILIYATMDSYAWAVSDKAERKVGRRFESFVANWVLPNHPLPCQPTDLYGARCAILHTLTGDSGLSKAGSAKTVAYAWGTAEADAFAEAIGHLGGSGTVTLHIEDLANALFDAMLAVHERATTDATVEARLTESAERHYQHLEKRTVDEFLRSVHDKPAVELPVSPGAKRR